jgi:heterodisulfide reductase subunit A
VEAGRSPNIEIITNAEVRKIDGSAGDFSVSVIKRPRYVDLEKCTGCGFCSQYCPVKIQDPYNQNLSEKKAIDIPYTQAVPAVYYVDHRHCLFLNRKECKQCSKACQAGAIDFDQKPEEALLNVGAVVLASGFKDINPASLTDYKYLEAPNVLTGTEFERVSCASGPYLGKIRRPSDLRKPQKVALIQCAGSRQSKGGNPYCSSVCCKYAVKDAIVALEHEPDLDIAIFFMDMRMYGKGLEEFYRRAKEAGIKFIRSRISEIRRDTKTEDLTIKYVTEDGALLQETFNLVVLPTGLEPSDGSYQLSRAADIGLNRHGFFKTSLFNPLTTDREGIFAVGGCREPVALPESVVQASGAAACASELLARVRGSLISEKQFPEEAPGDDEQRIGVFICHCGKNIAGVVDAPAVAKHASTLPDVVMSTENLYSCSKDAQTVISEKIRQEKLNKVVIAACTPRTHEPLFQETLREAGLNKCLVEMANIRDQCAWVHAGDAREATAKAKELVRMAVAKARHIEALTEPTIELIPKVLVVGGGLSGMTAALSVAEQGFECFLVEKGPELGGNLRKLYYTLRGDDPRARLKSIIEEVQNNDLIEVHTGTEVEAVDGFVGNFRTVLATGGNGDGKTVEIQHGALILATGARPYIPETHLYGRNNTVVIQDELERRLATGEYAPADRDTVLMIQCVGSRDSERPYCSSICCNMAIKNALKIKELNRNTNVYVLYRDMTTYGFYEDFYSRARDEGVVFIRYEDDRAPVVSEGEGGVTVVSVYDPVLDADISIPSDLVALSTAIVPETDEKWEKALAVPRSSDGFFLESHVQLNPVDSYVDGIYLCGMAHFPKPLDESIAQAKAAASKASILLSKGYKKAEPIISSCDEDKCIGCGLCEHFCPYSAIKMAKREKKKKAEIISAACKGCGVCATYCPAKALSMGRFTDEQIIAQIEAFGAFETGG